jgi:LPXTG-site transpeptidase (sortase) family protein
LLAAAPCMTPDPTSHPARRVTRGLAWLIAGLALVAVAVVALVVASGSDEDPSARWWDRIPKSALAPTPGQTAQVEQSHVPLEPDKSQAKAVEGPYSLRIPRIGVDAPVVAIQSNEDRVLDPPRDPGLAGWWSDGAAPGASEGSAVVVGHTVHAGGGGVFDDMGDLRGGDTIEVEGADEVLTYEVESVDVISKDVFARDAGQILAQDGPGRLVVITCDDWDGSVWRSNIVAVAVPV